MYEGWPVSIDTLVNPKFAGDRTPVSIINVRHLDFSDQAYVVGYIAYLIWFWMQRLAGTYDPYHFEETIHPDGLTFDYQILPGPTRTRSAIALLEINGAPSKIVQQARKRVAELDSMP